MCEFTFDLSLKKESWGHSTGRAIHQLAEQINDLLIFSKTFGIVKGTLLQI